VALEAAWLAATAAAAAPAGAAAWLPLVLASAAAAAAALFGMHDALLRPRLAAVAAEEGDEAVVQVSIRLETSSAALDDTRDTIRSGLRVRVGAPAEGGPATAWAGSAAAAAALGPRALDALVAAPGSHWRPLVPLIEAALPGALLGEVVSVPFVNGGASSSSYVNADPDFLAQQEAPLYRNRELCWWQPAADVAAKFGGRVPDAGEVFLFPVNGRGAWLWTAVRAVGSEHVELDANYGTEGQALVMEVEVVEIVKRPRGGQQPAPAGAA
jgi:hypothetical protein